MNKRETAIAFAKKYLNFEGSLIKMGNGAFADVWRAGDTIVKVTTDPDDAILMNRVRTGSYSKVVDVYNVYESGRYFIITTEVLRVLKREYNIRDGEGYDDKDDILIDYLPAIRWNIERNFDKCTREQLQEMIESDTTYFINVNNCEDMKVYLYDFNEQLLDILDDIKPLNMVALDIHAFNIGWDKAGTLKILDLGCESSDRIGEIEKINLNL